MGYALLWIEELAFWSCFWALGVALASRIDRWGYRWLVLAIFAGIPIAFLATVVTVTGIMELREGFSTNLFVPCVSLSTLVLVVGVILSFRGLRKAQDEHRKASRWDLRLVALLTVGTLLVHTLTFWNLDLSVRQQMDAQRIEAGALATSVAPPPVPDRENAAFLYQQAFDGGLVDKKPPQYESWLKSTSPRSSNEPVTQVNAFGSAQPVAPFDPRSDEDFVAYVAQNSEMCRLLREAAARPSCNFARDWARPSFAMLLQETQNMRGAVRDLQLEAHFAAPSNLRLAFADLVAMHRISDHVGQEPLLVSMLVSFALENVAVANLESLLQEYPAGSDELDLLDEWRPIPATPRMQRALRMEEAFGVSTMCQIAERPTDAQAETIGMRVWPPSVSPIYRVFMLRDDLAYYQDLFRQWHAVMRLPFAQRKDAVEKINASLKSSPGGIISRLLLPALDQVAVAAHRTDSHQRLAQLGIAAHRFRLEKGEFPESVEELVKFSKTIYAIDPFSGELFKMTRRDGSVILYSVGPDLEDNDGLFQSSDSPKYDVTFVLKTPPVPASGEASAR